MQLTMTGAIQLRARRDVFLAVDPQGAFIPGLGGLPVEGGAEIIPVTILAAVKFERPDRYVSIDRHPQGHVSLVTTYKGFAAFTFLTRALIEERLVNGDEILAANALFTIEQLLAYLDEVGGQVLWPEHAVDGSGQDRLVSHVETLFPSGNRIVKGTDPVCDSYSAFLDNRKRDTGLAGVMRANGAERVFLTGLAEDFCVGWTALDARSLGFEVVMIGDGMRPIAAPTDVANVTSLDQMRKQLVDADVYYIEESQLLAP